MRIPLDPVEPYSFYQRWSPALGTRIHDIRPPVGPVIAMRRQPWRVVAIHEISPVDWTDDDRTAYEREAALWAKSEKPAPTPETWRQRPYTITVRPAAMREHVNENRGTKSFGIYPYRGSPDWFVLPDHYAVCVQCGELAPCRELTSELEAARQAAILEKRLSVLPGCCWSCHEPITKRQKSITFDGPNLEIPGGPEPVTFHLRQDCHGSARNYEMKWVAADPRRRPTLHCPGRIIIHLDGPDCTEGELCSGEGTSHEVWTSHTGYVRTPALKLFEYIAENGVDDKVRQRGLYGCLRCIDAFERGVR